MFHDELPDIANLYCAAGNVSFRGVDVSATGLGDSLEEAVVLQNAEFAERKSFILGPAERSIKPVWDAELASWAAGAEGSHPGQDIECLAARNLASGTRSWFPARLISGFRRPVVLMAEGTAAGTDVEMAVLNAMREAIERYAARSWWLGLKVPTEPSARAKAHFDRLQRHWCRRHVRRTELLNITPEFGVPVFVAWSCREDGRGLCFGTACHPREKEAVRGALRELLQMEFGLGVIEYRKQNGVALAGREQVMLDRARCLNFDDCTVLLTPDGQPVQSMESTDPATSAQLAAHLSQYRISFHAIDLPTTDAPYRVVQTFSPDLRLPRPSAAVPHRSGGRAMRWTRWDLY